eukprot:SAG31_NODE_10220_length_1168_cov_1.601497_2_plen_74_part_00
MPRRRRQKSRLPDEARQATMRARVGGPSQEQDAWCCEWAAAVRQWDSGSDDETFGPISQNEVKHIENLNMPLL